MATGFTTTVVLGKRKAQSSEEKLSLRLESLPPGSNELPTESAHDINASSGQAPAFIAHDSSSSRERRFKCLHEGCLRAYTKPSRLAEHERSHTGNRPFICATCNKKYLRETHLQAHSRSHLPSSARPFVCVESNCGKRFWTAQHLRVHSELHRGEKPFKCTEPSCDAAFLKHHQLREHVCSTHAPPGTKPYRCEHPGCDKSFLTNQKLRGHVKTHEEKRYTCVHATCLARRDASPTYFSTWTALQHHIRTVHPPICSHPACNGKSFKSQKGLRAHLKLHDQSEAETTLRVDFDTDSEQSDPPRKMRRGGEVGRDWVCDVNGCGKDFKSKKAFTMHNKVTHLGRRDFVCPHDACRRAFGYKHLLQRHLGKLHKSDSKPTITIEEDDSSSSTEGTSGRQVDVDDITGKAYALRAQRKLSSPDFLQCPHPDLSGLVSTQAAVEYDQRQCEYVFSRAYDLRRHLQAEHGAGIEKDLVDMWVKAARESKNRLEGHT